MGRARSRDAIVGEEHGTTGHSHREWYVDPIDGTKNFVRGVPVWATLIALAVDGEVVLGIVSAPQLHRRWWAVAGIGAWTGRSLLKATPCQVSDVRRLEDSSLSYASLGGWEERGRLDDFLALSRRCWRTRAYGDFWSYMLVAEGAVDLAAEPELADYDMAALDIIVREAGGRFSSLDGTDGPWGGNALASNGHLHEAALSFLGSLSDGAVDPDDRPRGPRLGARPATRGCPGWSRTRILRRTDRPRPARASRLGNAASTGGPSPTTVGPWGERLSKGAAMRIHDVLRAKPSHDVVTISPDATVRELVALLAEHNVGALIVSTDGSSVDGIVSERDVVRRLHSDERRAGQPGLGDHDRRGPHLRPREPPQRPDGADDRATDPARARGLTDGRLTGIISIGDVVKNRIGELEFERDQLDNYIQS